MRRNQQGQHFRVAAWHPRHTVAGSTVIHIRNHEAEQSFTVISHTSILIFRIQKAIVGCKRVLEWLCSGFWHFREIRGNNRRCWPTECVTERETLCPFLSHKPGLDMPKSSLSAEELLSQIVATHGQRGGQEQSSCNIWTFTFRNAFANLLRNFTSSVRVQATGSCSGRSGNWLRRTPWRDGKAWYCRLDVNSSKSDTPLKTLSERLSKRYSQSSISIS